MSFFVFSMNASFWRNAAIKLQQQLPPFPPTGPNIDQLSLPTHAALRNTTGKYDIFCLPPTVDLKGQSHENGVSTKAMGR